MTHFGRFAGFLLLALWMSGCTAAPRQTPQPAAPEPVATAPEPAATPAPASDPNLAELERMLGGAPAQDPTTPPQIEAESEEWRQRAEEAVKRHTLQEQQRMAESQQFYRLALSYRQNGDFESARSNARRSVEVWPTNTEAQKLLTELNEVMIGGRERYAASALAQEQLERYRVQIQQAALEITGHIREGERLYNARMYTEAVEEYENAEFKIKSIPLDVPELTSQLEGVRRVLARARESQKTEEARVEQLKKEAALAETSMLADAEKRQILRKIKELMDLAYMSYDQKKFDRSIQLCDEVLMISPHYPLAVQLREDAQKTRSREEYYTLLRRKVDQAKALLNQDSESVIPYTETVRFPSPAEWEKISRRIEQSVIRSGQESQEEDPEVLAIRHKLATSKITLNLPASTLDEIVAIFRGHTDLNIMIDPRLQSDDAAFDREKRIPFRVTNLFVQDALRYVLNQFALDYTIDQYKAVMITTPALASGVAVLELHDIADILVEIPNHPGPAVELQGPGGGGFAGAAFTLDDPRPATVDSENILTLIKENVAPGTWEDGQYTVELTPTGKQLLVNHTARVQRELREFLTRIRSFTGSMVSVTARFIAAYDDWLDDVGVDIINRPPAAGFDLGGTGGMGGVGSSIDDPSGELGPGYVVNESARTESYDLRAQTYHALNQADPITGTGVDPMSGRLVNQGGLGLQYQWIGEQALQIVLRGLHKSQRATLVQAPKLTVFNNQRSHIMVLSEHAYVQDLDPQIATAAAAYDPVIAIARHGIVLDVKPIVSNDRRFVTLELRPALAELQGIRRVDVTGNGNVIELPWLVLQKAETTVHVPDRGSILISGFRDITYRDAHSGVPILEHIPILNFFFTRKGKHEEKRRLMILVTPRIIDLSEEEERNF